MKLKMYRNLILLMLCATASFASAKPNFVFVLADDASHFDV